MPFGGFGGDPQATSAPLRLALVVPQAGPARWLADALKTLVAAGVIELVGGISVPVMPHHEPWLLGRYVRADTRRHRRSANLFEAVPVAEFLSSLPHLPVTSLANHAEARPVISFLTALRPDIILSGLTTHPPMALHGVAPLGMWQVFLDVDARQSLALDGIWPLLRGSPVTTAELLVLGATPSGDLKLASQEVATDRFSLARGRALRAQSASRMLQGELRRVQGRGALPALAAGRAVPGDSCARAPTSLEVFQWMVRQFPQRIRQAYLDRLHIPEWQVAVHIADVDGGPCTALERFRVIPSPAGTYQADPCVALHEGRYYLFVEQYVHSTKRGHIAVMELGVEGNPGPSRPVLERPYHLSYPCVFHWRDQWYMIPETMEHGTVELYRASSFPDAWELDRVLLEGVHACDATVHEQGNRWWMFVTLTDKGAAATEELHLYHSSTPLGPWQPLEANPVRRSTRGGRSAGRLFRMGDRWLRPGQDSARSYGHFIRMYEVQRLAPDGYEEVEAFQLGPVEAGGIQGLHTFSHVGRVTAIDLLKARPRWA